MAASDDGPSGGILRGHGIAFALAAIFGGIALLVAFAASDGAIFGISGDSGTEAGLPATEGQKAAIISRDSFDDAESTSPPQDTSSSPPETGGPLSEEQRQLLAMSDFPWDSVAGRHIASNQDLMNRFRELVSVQPGAEPLSMSDSVEITISRERTIDEEELDDIIDIPVELGDEEEPEEEEQDDEEETPQGDEGQDAGVGQNDDNAPPEEPTDDSESGDNSGSGGGDNSSGSGDGNSGSGNSTDSEGPSEDTDSGSGNSTDSEGPSEDTDSGSADDNNSTAAEIIITLD